MQEQMRESSCLLLSDVKEIVKENPELKIMDGILFQDRYGMIVQKGNDELKKQINKVLKRLIEEGKIDELILKYSK